MYSAIALVAAWAVLSWIIRRKRWGYLSVNCSSQLGEPLGEEEADYTSMDVLDEGEIYERIEL